MILSFSKNSKQHDSEKINFKMCELFMQIKTTLMLLNMNRRKKYVCAHMSMIIEIVRQKKNRKEYHDNLLAY